MTRQAKIAAVVALVALNVVLLVMLRDKMTDSRAGTEAQPTSSSSQGTPTAEPRQEEPDGPGAGGAPGVALGTDGSIVRTLAGSCDGESEPLMERSSDGGESFDEVGLPDIERIWDIRAASADEITVLGAEQDCDVRAFTTADGGESWEATDGGDLWLLADDGAVVSPAGDAEPGCVAKSVSAISDRNARVLCDNGEIRGTDDVGESWVIMGNYTGAEAAVFPSIGEAFVLAAGDGCEARVWSSGDGGGDWTPRGCAGDGSPEALAQNGDTLAAIVDGEVVVSTDGGNNWD